MLIIYSLIIIFAFLAFSTLMLNNYRNTQIRNIEIRLFQTANIVADTYKGNLEDIIFARIMVKSYGKQSNSRILVIDSNKEVLIDNFNSYIGKTINNKEIKSSLDGKSKSGLYMTDDKDILQLSVPIILNDGIKNKIIGTVLISTSLDSLNKDVEELKGNMLKIAVSALVVSLVLTIIATNNMTKPLRNLSYGVKRLSLGDLGYEVKSKTKGEIGMLIQAFNNMSHRLSKIEKSRKTFINSISHELKTPLTSMKVLIESLSMGENDIEIYKEYLSDIYGEAERMEDLVNYLMNSIKLEDIILDIKKEDLGEVLEDTVKLILPYAEKNGVALSFNNSKNIIVKCDRDRIREVLFNIIDNAIKYRDEEKEYNWVSITLEKSKNKAIITVEDNGLGIDEKNLPIIFQGGFRVLDESIGQGFNIEGYGIGLAIVKNIIDKHNWKISVESSLKLGSIFTITIPL
ncbi:sensor histidine kinase [Schnuerera ultunensis]|uniref:sensor histidine kinase n=1 Tax=Schnuerera ultunensis TaxID=45497 RepID=UPI000405C685|nr:HAMP domain-containing sensor histidine kinase [Schnuerera ultunensis]